MNSKIQYHSDILKKLSINIRDNIYSRVFKFKTNVFLCGGSTDNKESIRSKLDFYFKYYDNYIYKWKNLNIIYPEDVFEDLLVGKQSYDLLTLENILAESVDVIVIVPESPGSYTELGAFVNSDKLRKKVICVQDTKYKDSNSFINYGPIKLMKKRKEGEIIFLDFQKIRNMDFEYDIITELFGELWNLFFSISRVASYTEKKVDVSNIIQAENFILPCIYLLEPTPKKYLNMLIKFGSDCSNNKARLAVLSALAILSKKDLVYHTSEGYKLTNHGIEHFQKISERRKQHYFYHVDELDKIRIDILSWELRGKYPILL